MVPICSRWKIITQVFPTGLTKIILIWGYWLFFACRSASFHPQEYLGCWYAIVNQNLVRYSEPPFVRLAFHCEEVSVATFLVLRPPHCICQ